MNLEYDNLIGRPFHWGVNDCFALGREFFKQNFNIDIRNYARPSDWDADRLDLIRLLHEKEGFEMITDFKAKDLRPGDVLCVCIGASNPNHFAIYIGDGMLVHHLYGRLSSKDPYDDFWRNHSAFLLRHPDVPDLRPVYPDVDIRTLVDARYARLEQSE
ncbi:MAG: NlpC/P60 family protein [Sphingomonas sp.]|uniref:NlpC/P60 family protein n=1 Tax=Sphingomonas sp. TaxID=28214 RepID=UPI003F7DDF8A